MTGLLPDGFSSLMRWVVSSVTCYQAVQTFPGAKRVECVQLAGAFGAPPPNESASKLDALHTLRDIRMPSPLNVTAFTPAHT